MTIKIKRYIIGLCLYCFSAQSFAQCVVPVEPLSWLWWSNLAYEDDVTYGPGLIPFTYSYAFSLAAPQYLATDVDAGMGPSGEGLIILFNINYGPSYAPAWVRTYRGLNHCTSMSGGVAQDNYLCNTTTIRPDNAIAIFNDYYMSSVNVEVLHAAMVHELGHVLGMGHVNMACTNSVMRPAIGAGTTTTLNIWEILWLNSNY